MVGVGAEEGQAFGAAQDRTGEYASVTRRLSSTRDGGLFLYTVDAGTSRCLGRYADVNTPVP
ncbi:hypothetical protein AB0M64_21225 [Streptomyces sp. NPDC051771]|uniref:hypothetical protein n=1 Tax=Streptomyces sp. NPDC051771 TaxID=3154847 RepID=UPI0034364024